MIHGLFRSAPLAALFFTFSTILAAPVDGATLPTGFSEALVASGLSSPTAMQFAPDGRLFVCEQGGRLRVIKNGSLLSAPFVTLNVDSNGERGLLGVAFDPAFATNGFVYVYYTARTPTIHNRISRFTANGDVAVAGSEVIIFDLDNLSSATNHNGGALAFGPSDGKLYAAVGENANSANAQSMGTVLGKMLRLNPDGSIPADNPFLGTTSGKNRAIWALGLRNPFTFAFNPFGGDPFINDVGETTWEEINDGVAGANYGWPTTEGPTSNPAFKSPRYAYNHSTGGCAITGGAFYAPVTAQFPSDYANDYFFADFCAGWIRKLDPAAGNTVTTFATGIGAPVDLKVSEDGSLYYLSRDAGAVYRVQYASTAPTITSHPANLTVAPGASATFRVQASGAPPLQYQWLRNGVNIPGATAPDYTIAAVATSDNGARFRARVSNAANNVLSNEATLTVAANQAPTGTITQPVAGTLYSGGTVINYAGTASDPEDGTPPASAFTWQVDFHHDSHTHPFMAATTGAQSGSFTIPTVGETSANVWYRLSLTVRDSAGAVHVTQRDILPRKAVLTLATNPAGLQLKLDGQPVTTPLSFDAVVGMSRTIEATTPQSQGLTTYTFASWSDGGAASHAISVPATNTTYTATYQGGSPAPAPITLVQHAGKDAGTTTSSSLAFTSGNTTGNWIGVAVRGWHAGPGLTVTDTRGNIYRTAIRFDETVDGMTLGVFYAESIAGGANTVTVSGIQSGGTLRFAIFEYAGVATAGSLDVTKASQGTSTAPTTGPVTTTTSGDLVIGLLSTANSRTFTAGSGYLIQERVPAAPNTKLVVEDRIQAAAGSISANGTINTSDIWGAALAAFRPASGGSPAPSITSVSPTSGVVGTSVTLSGTNFGASQGASTVRFNGTTAAPTSWSATSVAVPVPAGATTGPVVVTVNGTPSNGVTFTVTPSGDTQAPTAPSGLAAAAAGQGRIDLTWGASTDNVGVTGYRVERCQGSGCASFAQVAAPAGTGTTFTDSGLPASTSFSYRVRAMDAAGNPGPYSNTATATTQPAPAGIILTQHTSKDAGTVTSSSLAFTSNNVAGNWIAVAIRAWRAGPTLTVSDTRGNTYRSAIRFNETVDGMTLAIFYAESIAGGSNTVTVSGIQSGGTLRFAILEYAGIAASGSLDGTAGAQGNSATPSSGNVTTTAGGDLVIGVLSTANARTFTAGSGFVIQERVPVPPNAKVIVEDQRKATAGVVAASGSLNSADNWGAVVAAFRAATGP